MSYLARVMRIKKAIAERSIVVLLFIMVLIVFSFAERDTKKIYQQYTKGTTVVIPVKPALTAATSTEVSTRLQSRN